MRYREHWAHHWRNTLLNWGKIPRAQLRSESFFSTTKKAHKTTCPFVFAATAAPSAGCSTAASSFPAVLEICAPMLLFQQRDPTDEMNEQRPQASSPEKSSQKPTPPSATEESARNHDDHKGTCERLHKEKVAKVRKTRILSIFFPRTEFLNGEIGPAANEMRSTTPKSADEWAMGLWRQSHPVSTNQKSEIPKSGEVMEWLAGRRGGTDNRRDTTTWLTTCFFFSFLFFSQKLDVPCFGLYWA